jgi:adenylyl cyclase-associated protein
MANTLHFPAGPSTANTQSNQLTAIIRRLEAATSRLEDIAASTGSNNALEEGVGLKKAATQGHDPGTRAPSTPAPPGLIAGYGESPGEMRSVTPSAPPTPALPPAIVEMDDLISNNVKTFVEAAKGLDTAVEEQVSIRERYTSVGGWC